ncbi:hypothetical protein [Gloeobacter morelensis]|uniref:Prevent-host-death family protein n=1 Tax=Gloeobacter morelensis MG652769 TaxID=2781736 RepID=A0ABY3PM51_9CYAN|nr:hypothetical protein [Gloeobacter morelensis]UFP94668.1 hypothetical protein ISF26_23570 [Gloeobacter morelensis MG652769]
MDRIGICEFRDKATYYLSAGRPLGIYRNNELIGVYVPLQTADTTERRERLRRSLEKVEALLLQVAGRHGLSEEELAGLIESADTPQKDAPGG